LPTPQRPRHMTRLAELSHRAGTRTPQKPRRTHGGAPLTVPCCPCATRDGSSRCGSDSDGRIVDGRESESNKARSGFTGPSRTSPSSAA